MIFQKRKIVENNSHCVRNEVEMELIENMLSAIAAHQFQKEKWFHFDFWSEYYLIVITSISVPKIVVNRGHASYKIFHRFYPFFNKIL